MTTNSNSPHRVSLRLGAWFCVGLIACLSLIPAKLLIRTGAPGQVEHVIAYFGTAVLLSLAYPGKWMAIIVALMAYGGLLEAAQTLIPGRHGHLIDAFASGSGALLGAVAVLLLIYRVRPGKRAVWPERS
jgi:VanZ family protein